VAEELLTDIRPSSIAGKWYPGQPDALAAAADKFLDNAADAPVPGSLVGLMVPHAGITYSGQVAAHAFKLVRGASYERVVVVCPMHAYFPDRFLTSGHQAYETPLGTIRIDRESIKQIDQAIGLTPVRRDQEHALEIELPFLQRALDKPFALLPLMVRDQSYVGAETLGKAVAQAVQDGKSTLLVASSDLSHFYSEPEAHKLDKVMLDCVEAYDPQGVIRLDDEGKAFACGRAAIAAVLVAARELGATNAKIVGYGTSGDTTGDRSQVVGYGAAAIYKTN
jgi:MEMO1 family protein